MDFVPIPNNKGTAVLVDIIPKGVKIYRVNVTLPQQGAQVYFRILAFNMDRVESVLSNEASRDFLKPSKPTGLRVQRVR